jgi:8-oxoguanine deaminase
MLGELRNCFLLQRLGGGSSAITARQVIRLATSGGAGLLGRDDIGTIEAGKCADLVGVDISDISHAGSLHDYLGSIVLCGTNHNVALTIANGRVVVRDGRLLTVDEEEVVRRANDAARRLRNA